MFTITIIIHIIGRLNYGLYRELRLSQGRQQWLPGQLQRVGWYRVGVASLVRGNVTGVVVIRKHPGEVF